jgi:hypothetical protein
LLCLVGIVVLAKAISTIGVVGTHGVNDFFVVVFYLGSGGVENVFW